MPGLTLGIILLVIGISLGAFQTTSGLPLVPHFVGPVVFTISGIVLVALKRKETTSV